MNDKKLFEEVLNSVVERYRLEIRKPYGDCGYVEFYDNRGTQLGGINYSGYSLLYNCKQLADALSDLLR